MTKNALSIIYLLNFLRFGPVVVCYITNHFAVNTDFLFVSLACGFSLFFLSVAPSFFSDMDPYTHRTNSTPFTQNPENCTRDFLSTLLQIQNKKKILRLQ